MVNLNKIWKCPKNSCGNVEIEINRARNIIDTTTHKEIVLHFLKHLKSNNIFFGSVDIQEIFLNNTPENILTEEDKNQYSDGGKIWKNRIRSALNILTTEGYIETEESPEITDFFNEVEKNQKPYRSRKRTEKFYEEYKNELYYDWELYSLKKLNNIELEEGTITFIIPNPSPNYPFLQIENGEISSNSHGQIQRKEFYEFFKIKIQETRNNFSFNLKYLSYQQSKIFEDQVKASIKGDSSNAVLLIIYFKKLITGGYCKSNDLLPGNILKFSKIRGSDNFLLEIKELNSEEEKESYFMEGKQHDDILSSFKAIFDYLGLFSDFFDVSEDNKEDLIKLIYENNDLNYFEDFLNDLYVEGPVNILRYKILMKFIENKKNKLNKTQVDNDFIENTIDELCTTGYNGKKFQKNSYDIWKQHYYARVLLSFYDYKYKIENKNHFLNIVKFIIEKLNLEEKDKLKSLKIDKWGNFIGQKKKLSKNIKIENVRFTIIDFSGPSFRYSLSPWIAIYPENFNNHKRAYQLFLGFNNNKGNRIDIGIYSGSKVITNICKDNTIKKPIIPNFKDGKFLSEIIEFYERNRNTYYKLNSIEKKYRNFNDINCWFASPEPPKDEVYENNMFVKMMGEGYFALGWPEFQVNMSDMNVEDIKSEWNKIDSSTSPRIKNHIYIKEEMKKGDIIIAKKGDNPSNPDNRIYGIGYINSYYKFDKDLDPYKATDNHYRDVIWIINFYNDNLLGIIKNPYLDLKEMGASLNNFDRTTLVKKNYDFYLNIKKTIKLKLKELREKKLLEDKIYDNYLKKFQKLEDTIRCIKASLSDEVSNPSPPLDIKKLNLEKLLGLKILKFLKREMNIYEEEK